MLRNLGERYLFRRLRKDERKATWIMIIEGLFIVILLANAIVLNYYLIKNITTDQSSQAQTQEKITKTIPSPTTTPNPTNPPPLSPAPTSAQTASTQITNSNPIKEHFIPIGTGTSDSGDWKDVEGARADLDFGKFQNIEKIRFEASVNVPTANQWVAVRLYNVSDNHPVWFSEIVTKGEKTVYLVSPDLVYDIGFKTYQVQMKTQLQKPADLTMSRLHILLK